MQHRQYCTNSPRGRGLTISSATSLAGRPEKSLENLWSKSIKALANGWRSEAYVFKRLLSALPDMTMPSFQHCKYCRVRDGSLMLNTFIVDTYKVVGIHHGGVLKERFSTKDSVVMHPLAQAHHALSCFRTVSMTSVAL